MQDNGQNAVFLSGTMNQFCLIKGYGTCVCVWGGKQLEMARLNITLDT